MGCTLFLKLLPIQNSTLKNKCYEGIFAQVRCKKGVIYGEYHFRDRRRLRGQGSRGSKQIQNRAARIVSGSPYDASAAPIIQNLGWSTISNLVRKETATLTYKSCTRLLEKIIRKMFG